MCVRCTLNELSTQITKHKAEGLKPEGIIEKQRNIALFVKSTFTFESGEKTHRAEFIWLTFSSLSIGKYCLSPPKMTKAYS